MGREAYDLGVRYIGGCCGFEPYHIRAMCEELRDIRGKIPESSDKSDYDLSLHGKLEQSFARYKNKGSEKWWKEMSPCTKQSSRSNPSSPSTIPPTLISTRNFI